MSNTHTARLEKNLKKLQSYNLNIEHAKKLHLMVGLPIENASKIIYKKENSNEKIFTVIEKGVKKITYKKKNNNEKAPTVIEVGVKHELGINTPQRSFLKMPFFVMEDEMNRYVQNRFNDMFEKNRKAYDQVSLIGLKAVQIVQDAFTNQGYGNWQPLSPVTIEQKGSSQILIDTGTLRGSITHVVRS